MGGGHSDPVSIQNDGINVSGTYSGDSHTTISHITSGPTSNTQTAKSKGSKTGVTVNATVPLAPALLMNLNLLDTLKKDAEKVGTTLVHGAEWCYSNPTCKANAEKYGTQAALAIANKVEGKTVLLIL